MVVQALDGFSWGDGSGVMRSDKIVGMGRGWEGVEIKRLFGGGQS